MAAPDPPSAGLYCDPLWTTSILPVIPGRTKTPGLAASINGIRVNAANPDNVDDMILIINGLISTTCYSGAPSGFDCKTMCIGSRYIIMSGGAGSVPSTVPQLGDQLIVTAPNVYTYTQADWRIPPNYLPGV
jgi:hypothetical protein